MSIAEGRKTLSIDEVSRRLLNAERTIDLGVGSLLGPPSSSFTEDDMEKSLNRLLQRILSLNNDKHTYLR